LLAVLFAATTVSQASVRSTTPVPLTPVDTAAVSRAACPENPGGAERLNAYRYSEVADKSTWVDVTCAAERKSPEGQIRRRAVCSRTASGWKCQDEGEFLGVSVRSRTVHIPIREFSLDTAAGIARTLLRAETYDGRSFAREIDGKVCYLRPSAQDINAWLVTCESFDVHVARDCDRRGCTYRLFGPLVSYIP
jgi:hypothetical protein